MAGGHPYRRGARTQPNEFRLATSLRLGFPTLFVNLNIQCECGRIADEYHLITCKLGGRPVSRLLIMVDLIPRLHEHL